MAEGPQYISFAGTATIDFGAAPGRFVTTLLVTGQSSIAADSHVRVTMQGDTSADHTDANHIAASSLLTLVAADIVPGVGFTIYALASARLTGRFTVHWDWE